MSHELNALKTFQDRKLDQKNIVGMIIPMRSYSYNSVLLDRICYRNNLKLRAK